MPPWVKVNVMSVHSSVSVFVFVLENVFLENMKTYFCNI